MCFYSGDCFERASADRLDGATFGTRQHVIFGWLQIDDIVNLGPDESHALIRYPWLVQHPHVRSGWKDGNAVFIAKVVLTLGDGTIPGFGVFDHSIMLTMEGAATPSAWAVPTWLDPTNGGVGMTYHPPSR